jgi:hypothetical protein
MSRSAQRPKVSRHWPAARRTLRACERRAERHALHAAMHLEAREPLVSEELCEVLADLHEEAGRPRVAELLRRGR